MPETGADSCTPLAGRKAASPGGRPAKGEKEEKTMNRVLLTGRLSRDPQVRTGKDAEGNERKVAHYSLAVQRRRGKDGQEEADFIDCTAFGRGAEFAEKYLTKGTRIALQGRLRSGSYTNRDGAKVYTTEVIVDEQEFAGSRPAAGAGAAAADTDGPEFTEIPPEIEEEVPFR